MTNSVGPVGRHRVLLDIAEHPAVVITHIAERIGLTHASVSMAVRDLALAGLIELTETTLRPAGNRSIQTPIYRVVRIPDAPREAEHKGQTNARQTWDYSVPLLERAWPMQRQADPR